MTRRYLIEHGARLDVVNSDGELPVDIAEGEDVVNLLTSHMDAQGERNNTITCASQFISNATMISDLVRTTNRFL